MAPDPSAFRDTPLEQIDLHPLQQAQVVEAARLATGDTNVR